MSRLGVLGGGQLGRMLASAALPLGIRTRAYEPAVDACFRDVGPVTQASFDDLEALEVFADSVDVVTFEFENVPAAAVEHLRGRGFTVHPGPAALHTAQDRWNEKQFFHAHGVRTAPCAPVSSVEELEAAVESLGLPAILKTRRMGYDGKGQQYLAHPEQSAAAWAALGGVPCILERVVSFDREVSLLSVRSTTGEIAHYPLIENHHAGGVLRWSEAPASVDADVQAAAETMGVRILEALDYVGVIAVEWFQVGTSLLANELAPRVHNSGHGTLEGAATSQFENHVRAVKGLPLGSTEMRPCVMLNLLGRRGDRDALLRIPGLRLHDYGKTPRPGRKIGHVTLTAPDVETLGERTRQVRALIEEA